MYVCVSLSVYLHIFQIFSFKKYAGGRLTCKLSPCVLLHLLAKHFCYGERSKKRNVLTFLGRSHFEMFYNHTTCMCTFFFYFIASSIEKSTLILTSRKLNYDLSCYNDPSQPGFSKFSYKRHNTCRTLEQQ